MDDLGSMALTIPGTMTVGSMWKTANTLTLSVPDKMCTGTVTGALQPTTFGKALSNRISVLRKLRGCITMSIIPIMWMPRMPGTRKPGTPSATAL